MIVSKTEVTVILSPKMDMRVDKFTAKSGGGGGYQRKRPGISVHFYYGISIQCLQQTEVSVSDLIRIIHCRFSFTFTHSS